MSTTSSTQTPQTQHDQIKRSASQFEDETQPFKESMNKWQASTKAADSAASPLKVEAAAAKPDQAQPTWNAPTFLELTTNRPAADKRFYYVVKRSIDFLFAVSALILITPVLVTVALLIRFDSPGPIIFKQERVGARRRRIKGQWQWEPTTFTMYKFRSMKHNVDSARHKDYVTAFIRNDQQAMEQQNPDAHNAGVYKLTNDSRITRVGKYIRASSIDELPQLFNVLKGDMSLVGPRPALQYEVAEYKDWHRRRLTATPGLTGLWQVSARSAVDFDTMVKLDIEYVETQNLMLDFKILWFTPNAVISRSGAK